MKARLWCLLALLLAGNAAAQSYRWVDAQGRTHYGDRPPPAAAQLRERQTPAPAADKTLPYALRQAVANYPVTLYVAAQCAEGCQEGRDYLKARGVPFTEKPVATREEAAALKQRLGADEAVVPVLTVGTRHAKGWLRSDWQTLLDAAGYPRGNPR